MDDSYGYNPRTRVFTNNYGYLEVTIAIVNNYVYQTNIQDYGLLTIDIEL